MQSHSSCLWINTFLKALIGRNKVQSSPSIELLTTCLVGRPACSTLDSRVRQGPSVADGSRVLPTGTECLVLKG